MGVKRSCFHSLKVSITGLSYCLCILVTIISFSSVKTAIYYSLIASLINTRYYYAQRPPSKIRIMKLMRISILSNSFHLWGTTTRSLGEKYTGNFGPWWMYSNAGNVVFFIILLTSPNVKMPLHQHNMNFIVFSLEENTQRNRKTTILHYLI